MTQFLMIFIPFTTIIGIVFIPIAVCREDEGKGLVGFFKGLAVTLAFGLVFSFGLFAQAKDNDNKWNEGLCLTVRLNGSSEALHNTEIQKLIITTVPNVKK